jgi:hypothetical protein
MNPWICALLITGAGAIGGLVNALIADKGFYMPTTKKGIICPGFFGNILIGGIVCICFLVFLWFRSLGGIRHY